MSETKDYIGASEDFAIVELFGHTTMVGRICEVEQFGIKMLAMEPLFNDAFLPVVYHGGAAIYRLTPCTREIAFERQPRHEYQLPPAIRAILPRPALPAPAPTAQESIMTGFYHLDSGLVVEKTDEPVKAETCSQCGESFVTYWMCDKEPSSFWCEACFSETPCGQDAHGEECPTFVAVV